MLRITAPLPADLPPLLSGDGQGGGVAAGGGASSGPAEQRWLELIREYLSISGGARAYEQLLELVERLLLTEALQRSKGNQTHASKLLGLPRPTLHAKLQRFGLRDPGPEPRTSETPEAPGPRKV